MRTRKTAGGVTVHAIAGTYVVMLGLDADAPTREGLLGFAIERIDKTEGEQYWLTGMRTFKSVYPNPPQGALVSTHAHASRPMTTSIAWCRLNKPRPCRENPDYRASITINYCPHRAADADVT